MENIENRIKEIIQICDEIEEVVKKFDDPYKDFRQFIEKVNKGKIRNARGSLRLVSEDNEPASILALFGEEEKTHKDVYITVSVMEDGEVYTTLLSNNFTDIFDSKTEYTIDGDYMSYQSKSTGREMRIEVNETILGIYIKYMSSLLKAISSYEPARINNTDPSKKYGLTDEVIRHNGKKLYRIQAYKDFGNVDAGDKGGFVESEANLSHDGECWIFDDGKVYGNAVVSEDAEVREKSEVYDKAQVYGDAQLYGYAQAYGEAKVYGYAQLLDNAHVYGKAKVYGSVRIYDEAEVYDKAQVYGYAEVYQVAVVNGNSKISKRMKITGEL